MADAYPELEHDLKDVEKILKLVVTKFDGTGDYPSWCFGLKIQLTRYKLTHHLTVDDTNDLNVGQGNHQAKKLLLMRVSGLINQARTSLIGCESSTSEFHWFTFLENPTQTG